MSNIQKELEFFFQYLEAQGYTKASLGFREGATEEEILAVEQQTGISLPDDVKDFLHIVNGQDWNSPILYYFKMLPTSMQWLGTYEMIQHWKWQMEAYSEEDTLQFWNEAQADERIRGIVFHPKWLPIAEQEGIAHAFLDFVPTQTGTAGQLIADINECDFVVLSSTLTAFFTKLNTLIQKGAIGLRTQDPDYGDGVELYEVAGNQPTIYSPEELVALFENQVNL